MKIAVVTPIPTPYRDAFWNHLAQMEEVSLHVFYCAGGKADRPWKSGWTKHYQNTCLPGRNLLAWRSSESSLYFNAGILKALRGFQPEAILIGGYNHLTMLLAMLWAGFTRTPFFLMSETREFRTSGGFSGFLKNRYMRWIAKRSRGALPTGKAAAAYLNAYGWRESQLWELPNVPDIQHFQSRIRTLRTSAPDLRKKWQLGQERIFLFVGRLVRKKHVDHLIQAFAKLEAEAPVRFIMIGDGDQRRALETLCGSLSLQERVRFMGFLDPEDILEWLAISDVFALASHETWGVAPIEAAAADQYLLLSSEVGAAAELKHRYEAMQIVPHGDHEAWTAAMAKALQALSTPSSAPDKLPASLEDWKFGPLAAGLLNFLRNQAKTGSDSTP